MTAPYLRPAIFRELSPDQPRNADCTMMEVFAQGFGISISKLVSRL
jgi:hypothetical protein